MSKANYKNCLAVTLKWEGGFSDHPKDPGGATMRGIIQTEYDKWRTRWGKPKQSVKKITEEELQTIYKEDYWINCKGDKLKAGVDLCAFDSSVLSGTARWGQWVRRALGYKELLVNVTDKETEALNKLDPVSAVKKLCDIRLAAIRTFRNFDTFGKGWTNRIADVRANALAMASKGNPQVLLDDATQQDKKTAGEASKAIKTVSTTIPTSATASVATSVSGYDWTPILMIGGSVLLIGVGVTVYYMIKSKQYEVISNTLRAKAEELINGRA